MFEDDLNRLLSRGPDRRLETLESDVWAGVSVQERSKQWGRRLLALQALVLAVALIGSVLAGQHWRTSHHGTPLDVFSPQLPLGASTLLTGGG